MIFAFLILVKRIVSTQVRFFVVLATFTVAIRYVFTKEDKFVV